jgi:hypothetical protein
VRENVAEQKANLLLPWMGVMVTVTEKDRESRSRHVVLGLFDIGLGLR